MINTCYNIIYQVLGNSYNTNGEAKCAWNTKEEGADVHLPLPILLIDCLATRDIIVKLVCSYEHEVLDKKLFLNFVI